MKRCSLRAGRLSLKDLTRSPSVMVLGQRPCIYKSAYYHHIYTSLSTFFPLIGQSLSPQRCRVTTSPSLSWGRCSLQAGQEGQTPSPHSSPQDRGLRGSNPCWLLQHWLAAMARVEHRQSASRPARLCAVVSKVHCAQCSDT